jgi:hypothetical protein
MPKTFRRRGLAAVIAALAAITLVAPPAMSASAARTLTAETLNGTGTTAGGGICAPSSHSISGLFQVSGTASGPYPGTFTEVGSFKASGLRNPPWFVRFSASFTITSGTTTITGKVNAPWPTGTFIQIFACPSTVSLPNLRMTYSAVINTQTYTGTAKVNGTFNTASVTASVYESFS